MKKVLYAMDEIKAWVKSAYSLFLVAMVSWDNINYIDCIYNLTKRWLKFSIVYGTFHLTQIFVLGYMSPSAG